MKYRATSIAIGLLGLVCASGRAAADCAAGAGYTATVADNTVTVCPTRSVSVCGSSIDFLRQGKADGTVVSIGNSCSSNGCYVDECVPPGSYRYGYATPFDCSEAGCGIVALFAEVTVATPLSQSCTRTTSGAGPTLTATTPPWGTGSGVSTSWFKKCGGCDCGAASSGRGSVRFLDMLALGSGLFIMGLRARHGHKSVTRSQS